jgi:thioredoxin 1
MSTIVNADDSQTFSTEVLQSELPVLVDFWAAWCGPCRMVAPEVEKIAEAHPGELKVVKVDVDANQEVAASYGIFSIPTLGLFRAGQLVAQSVGAKPRRTIESDLGLAGVLEEARR